MKTKEITINFEYTTPENLDEILDIVKTRIKEGVQYHEKVYHTNKGARFILLKQEYKKLRSFKLVAKDYVLVKSNV